MGAGPPAALERLADGFQFTEGPVWHEGALYFNREQWPFAPQ